MKEERQREHHQDKFPLSIYNLIVLGKSVLNELKSRAAKQNPPKSPNAVGLYPSMLQGNSLHLDDPL